MRIEGEYVFVRWTNSDLGETEESNLADWMIIRHRLSGRNE
jgi:hypothetical protein